MKQALDWLDGVVVVNESKDENLPGDVAIYRSEGDACAAFEDWWVKSSEGHAFTATGVRLILKIGPSGEVIVDRRETCAEGPTIVRLWLQALALTTLEARKRVASQKRAHLSSAEVEALLPTSIEGLIAYIGFPWTPPRSWFVPGCLVLLLLVIALVLGFIATRLA